MVKEELFNIFILKEVIILYGVYFVKRGAVDRSVICVVMNSLVEGWVVGIFLQGIRIFDGKIIELKLGVVLIVVKVKVLLLLVCVWGIYVVKC